MKTANARRIQTRRDAAQQRENALAATFGREPRNVSRVLPVTTFSEGCDVVANCYDDLPTGVSCEMSYDRRRDVVG